MKNTILLILLLATSYGFSQILEEDFDGFLGLPSGWTIDDIAGGGDVWTFANTGELPYGIPANNTFLYDNFGFSGNYAIYDNRPYENNGISENTALESPFFDASNATTIILSFTFAIGTSSITGVPNSAVGYVEVFDGSSWIEVRRFDDTFGGNPGHQVNLSSQLAGVSNAKVRFRWEGDNAFFWGIDNVLIEDSGCVPVYDITADQITTTSADISWEDENGSGVTFDIEYGPLEAPFGDFISSTTINNIATTNLNLSGLIHGSYYRIDITANCTGANGSSLTRVFFFETLYDCSLYPNEVPHTETFFNDLAFQDCFIVENVDGDSGAWYSGLIDVDGAPGVDTGYLVEGGTNLNKDNWFFTPAFNLTAGTTYSVSSVFAQWWRQPTSFPGNSFEAFIVSTPSSTATPEATLFSLPEVPLQISTLFFTNEIAQALYPLAEEVTSSFTPTSSGSYHIAYRSFDPPGSTSFGFMFFYGFSINATLSTDTFETNALTYYYNKATETFNLTSANLPMTDIEIYTISGQKVFFKEINRDSDAIKVSFLSDGLYLAKIGIGEGFETIKFVKY